METGASNKTLEKIPECEMGNNYHLCEDAM